MTATGFAGSVWLTTRADLRMVPTGRHLSCLGRRHTPAAQHAFLDFAASRWPMDPVAAPA